MNDTKEDRIKVLYELMEKITQLMSFYRISSPGYSLLQNACSNIHVLKHIESNTDFYDERSCDNNGSE